ncbi:tyrosyl-tRNA synthetase [Anopheles sinensis]|uniref:Tyrosyl-tRNA synthetase n=1 Tax=Anopheles sinensis TaxID=74873 RepID=A0A084VKM0_ANOSI|nr:tyrosyl-tRNA synthetase [Anopheles sinensis]
MFRTVDGEKLPPITPSRRAPNDGAARKINRTDLRPRNDGGMPMKNYTTNSMKYCLAKGATPGKAGNETDAQGNGNGTDSMRKTAASKACHLSITSSSTRFIVRMFGGHMFLGWLYGTLLPCLTIPCLWDLFIIRQQTAGAAGRPRRVGMVLVGPSCNYSRASSEV